MLGGKKIHLTKSYKYLGMMMDEKGCERTKNEIIGRAIQWIGRLGSISRCRTNKYDVVRGV